MDTELITVGWREWVSLPDIGLPWLKAKIDSGQNHSILHTFITESFQKKGIEMVRFGVHPHQHKRDIAVLCEAPVLDIDEVINANGEKKFHYRIETTLKIGTQQWPIKLLLVAWEEANFRLVLGHTSIDRKLMVDPSSSYLTTSLDEDELLSSYSFKTKNS